MNVSEKLMAVAENMPKVYAAGEAAASAVCAMQHFAAMVMGDGGTALVFELPFEPDLICLTGFHPINYMQAGSVIMLVAEMASLASRWCIGSARLASGGSDSYVMKPSSVRSRCFRMSDGRYTIQNLPTSSGTGAFFSDGLPYVITAVKYTDKTRKERITEYVQSLTGNGTTTLGIDVVNESFSDAEWAALIATKPNWTFMLK